MGSDSAEGRIPANELFHALFVAALLAPPVIDLMTVLPIAFQRRRLRSKVAAGMDLGSDSF
jgi:hypothetical protein